MNILLLSQFFSTTRGGGEYVFSLIAKNLAKNNHKVHVITNEIVDEKYNVHENIKLYFVPPLLEYKGGLPPGFIDNMRYSFNAIISGLRIIKNEKIDIIHSNNFSPSLAGSMLSSITSIPHITTIHDVFSLCGRNYWKMWGKQNGVSGVNVLIAPFFERLMIKLKHVCIHTVSEATRDDLLQFGAKKPIYVIHNAIETSPVIESRIDINQLQFVYVGRLVFYKNLEIVIKAINIVKKTEPKVKLIIIGGGPHKKELEKMVRNLQLESNIEFRGYVSSEEKTKLIATSVALAFPSICEGFGLVILEAFDQGKPVLVSDTRPMSDIVLHGNTGYVLNPRDEKVWAEHFLKIMRNPYDAKIMGKNGNMLLTTLYNQDLMYNKIIDMYTKHSLKN